MVVETHPRREMSKLKDSQEEDDRICHSVSQNRRQILEGEVRREM